MNFGHLHQVIKRLFLLKEFSSKFVIRSNCAQMCPHLPNISNKWVKFPYTEASGRKCLNVGCSPLPQYLLQQGWCPFSLKYLHIVAKSFYKTMLTRICPNFVFPISTTLTNISSGKMIQVLITSNYITHNRFNIPTNGQKYLGADEYTHKRLKSL